MESLIKLKKDQFPSMKQMGLPYVRVWLKGKIQISGKALVQLELTNGTAFFAVSLFSGDKNKTDFYISKDDNGWPLRFDYAGGACFFNKKLAEHIIKTTWDSKFHPAGAEAGYPKSLRFEVASLPVDDAGNKK